MMKGFSAAVAMPLWRCGPGPHLAPVAQCFASVILQGDAEHQAPAGVAGSFSFATLNLLASDQLNFLTNETRVNQYSATTTRWAPGIATHRL
jgi:hypothetical protein